MKSLKVKEIQHRANSVVAVLASDKKVQIPKGGFAVVERASTKKGYLEISAADLQQGDVLIAFNAQGVSCDDEP